LAPREGETIAVVAGAFAGLRSGVGIQPAKTAVLRD